MRCTECGEHVAPRRAQLGYTTCIDCGSPQPVRTVVPMHKSNYVLVTDRALLRQINPKTATE